MTYSVWVEYEYKAGSEDCHTAPLELQYAISGAVGRLFDGADTDYEDEHGCEWVFNWHALTKAEAQQIARVAKTVAPMLGLIGRVEVSISQIEDVNLIADVPTS